MEEVPVIPGGPEPSTATTTTTGTDPILENPTVESKGKGVKKVVRGREEEEEREKPQAPHLELR